MLRDHHGKLITDQDLLGKFHLIYFGYTFCPDVCPTSLITLSSALNQIGELAEQVRPYFITVDPTRDTPEILNTYVTYFHPTLVGLTGTQAMVDRVAALYRIQYEKVEDPSRAADEYIIDHSSGLFLMAPDGKFITKFAHGIAPTEVATRLKAVLSQH
jgi:protein SCO1/2